MCVSLGVEASKVVDGQIEVNMKRRSIEISPRYTFLRVAEKRKIPYLCTVDVHVPGFLQGHLDELG